MKSVNALNLDATKWASAQHYMPTMKVTPYATTHSSKTSVLAGAAWRGIPEDAILRSRCLGGLKYYNTE
jgi:hypothetical protein